MSKKEIVKLIVMVLTAITTGLSALYLNGCSGLKAQCEGKYCLIYDAQVESSKK